MKILLVTAYLSMLGVPQIAVYERADMAACKKEATTWFNQLKAGSGRAWCKEVATNQPA